MITINGVTRTWEGMMNCRPELRVHTFPADDLWEKAKPSVPLPVPYDLRCVCGATTWGESMVVNPS